MSNEVEALIADANQSATIMEYLASFEPQDIEGDDVELRFELDGVDTGTDVSLVEQCGKASSVINALIAALEQSQKSNEFLKEQLSKLAKFNPDWDMLQACQTSWKEVSAELHSARSHMAELEASQLAVKLLVRHLNAAHTFIEHTDAFGYMASSGILHCDNAVWNIDESKEAIRSAGITVQGDE